MKEIKKKKLWLKWTKQNNICYLSERKGTNNEGECFDLFQSTRLDCVSVEMIVGGAPHAITTGPLINIVDHTGTCCLYFKTQDAHVASLTSTKSDRREQKKISLSQIKGNTEKRWQDLWGGWGRHAERWLDPTRVSLRSTVKSSSDIPRLKPWTYPPTAKQGNTRIDL